MQSDLDGELDLQCKEGSRWRLERRHSRNGWWSISARTCIIHRTVGNWLRKIEWNQAWEIRPNESDVYLVSTGTEGFENG